MINILMNQKPGLTDSVSCPTMEIPGRRITYYKRRYIRKRPITLLKWTTGGVSFQNEKGIDFANLITGDISGKHQGMILIWLF